MTSANVVEYRIFDKKDNEVGGHRQHLMCKSHWEDLLVKYCPAGDFKIQAFGYDEEDEYWEGEIESLYDFLVQVGEIELK